jgi:hypothetical protein
MNRRQMLQYSVQRLNRILPTIISAAGGMERWLNEKEKNSSRQAVCFPGSQKKRTKSDDNKKATCKGEIK